MNKELIDAINFAIFTLECIAHMQGKEREIMPVIQRLETAMNNSIQIELYGDTINASAD